MTFLAPGRRVALVLPVLAAAAAFPSVASAQATRTWVSGVGDDANPCSRTAPCKTFAGAISKTAVGGEIDALDDGGFGAVTITKSITIDGGSHLAGVLASGTNGVVVNSLSTPIRVTLRNLSINGAGNGLNGVRILGNAAVVRIENSQIFGFSQTGVDIAHTDGVSRRVEIRKTSIHGNYGSLTAKGVQIKPSNAATTSKVTIADSYIDDNALGLVADASAGRAKVSVRNTTFEDNGNSLGTGQGIQANGLNATVRVTGSAITGNTIGLETLNGGQIVSFGGNLFTANDGGGGFTTTQPLS